MNDVESRWRELRATMDIGKTQEDGLSTSMSNRHEIALSVKPATLRQRKSRANKLNRESGFYDPKPGEIPIKVWAKQIMDLEHISKSALWNRLKRGRYPNVIRRSINQRVVFVSIKP